jgi:hypothetical protein
MRNFRTRSRGCASYLHEPFRYDVRSGETRVGPPPPFRFARRGCYALGASGRDCPFRGRDLVFALQNLGVITMSFLGFSARAPLAFLGSIWRQNGRSFLACQIAVRVSRSPRISGVLGGFALKPQRLWPTKTLAVSERLPNGLPIGIRNVVVPGFEPQFYEWLFLPLANSRIALRCV